MKYMNLLRKDIEIMNANTFTTGVVRFSYEHLFQPNAAPGAEPCYSVMAMIPKTDAATISALSAAWEDAKQYGITTKWGGTLPPVLQGGLKDGDGVKSDGTPYGPECKGHYLLTCKTNVSNPPEIVDENLQKVIDPRKVYSGCYGRVNVSMVPYNNQSKGIKAILNCVQFLQDGEPLGGKSVSAAEAFAGSAAPAMPGYTAVPAAALAPPTTAVPPAPQAMPGYPAAASQSAPAWPQQTPVAPQAATGAPMPPAPMAVPGAYPQQSAVPGIPGAGQPAPTGMPVLGLGPGL